MPDVVLRGKTTKEIVMNIYYTRTEYDLYRLLNRIGKRKSDWAKTARHAIHNILSTRNGKFFQPIRRIYND